MLIAQQRGFTLPELLLALFLSGLLFSAMTAFMQGAVRRSVTQERQLRLANVMDNLLDTISKDLRRAGYLLNEHEQQHGIRITGTKTELCLVIRYVLAANRYRASHTVSQFLYRYQGGLLEYSRDRDGCTGNGWFSLVDSQVLMIEHFSVEHRSAGEAQGRLKLTLRAVWRADPTIRAERIKVVRPYNRVGTVL